MRTILSWIVACGIGVAGFVLLMAESYTWGWILLLSALGIALFGWFFLRPIDESEEEQETREFNEKQWNELIPSLEKKGYKKTSLVAIKAPCEVDGYLTEEISILGTNPTHRFTTNKAARKGGGIFEVYFHTYYAVIVPDDGSKIIVMSSK